MAIIIGIGFPMPTQATEDTRDYPLTVDFLDVIDDGVTVNFYYIQNDSDETLTKSRTIVFLPPVSPITDEGRSFIGVLSNGFTVWEKTENTLPDNRVRNP